MSEWWTYTLSDFLLFSARTYHRLFELYNAAIWPAQIAAAALALAVLTLLFRASAAGSRGRAVSAILGALWIWVAVAFLALRYATINWAAVYFAWAFGLEAALLLALGALGGAIGFARPADFAGRAGAAIFVFALVLEPAVGLAAVRGRGWTSAELFGVAPDPTAVGTLGLLLVARVRGRGWLMVVPAIWCVVAGLTLSALKSPDFWIPPAAAAVVIVVTFAQARARRRAGLGGASVEPASAQER